MSTPAEVAGAAAVTSLTRWAEERTDVKSILRALDELRRPEPMPATRTSVMTLIVVATSTSAAIRAVRGVHELGGRHPGRVLAVVVDGARRSGPTELDAAVELFGGEAEGHSVWFEDIRLHVAGEVVEHLDSLVEPFTLADVPVVAWFVDHLPDPSDPALRAADVVLVDARDFGDAACFETLRSFRSIPVVDLSWHRLAPWRSALAGLFEPTERRAFLDDIRSVDVSGHAGPSLLLAGWLVDRLDVEIARVHLHPAEHVSIRIVGATVDGRTGTFGVERVTDERTLRIHAEPGGQPPSSTEAGLAGATPGWGLASALAHLGRDPVFERALDHAVVLGMRHRLP